MQTVPAIGSMSAHIDISFGVGAGSALIKAILWGEFKVICFSMMPQHLNLSIPSVSLKYAESKIGYHCDCWCPSAISWHSADWKYENIFFEEYFAINDVSTCCCISGVPHHRGYQAITWSSFDFLSIWPSGLNFVGFLAATKQLYEWSFPSVCLSVRLSVCLSVTPFWLCSHLRIIMKFSGVITNDKSDVHAKGQGQRSKVKVTEVNTQLNRFRTVTPVWIHIWWWNDAYSLMMLRRGALLFLKVIRQISRSHGSKKRQIWPRLGVSGL